MVIRQSRDVDCTITNDAAVLHQSWELENNIDLDNRPIANIRKRKIWNYLGE